VSVRASRVARHYPVPRSKVLACDTKCQADHKKTLTGTLNSDTLAPTPPRKLAFQPPNRAVMSQTPHSPAQIGQMIKDARIAQGMTCRELGARVGVSRSAVSNAELGGLTKPSSIIRYAEALGMDAAALWGAPLPSTRQDAPPGVPAWMVRAALAHFAPFMPAGPLVDPWGSLPRLAQEVLQEREILALEQGQPMPSGGAIFAAVTRAQTHKAQVGECLRLAGWEQGCVRAPVFLLLLAPPSPSHPTPSLRLDLPTRESYDRRAWWGWVPSLAVLGGPWHTRTHNLTRTEANAFGFQEEP